MGAPYLLETDALPGLLALGEIRSEMINGRFIDIGIPGDDRRICQTHGGVYGSVYGGIYGD